MKNTDLMTEAQLKEHGFSGDEVAVLYMGEVIEYQSYMNRWRTAIYNGNAKKSLPELKAHIEGIKKKSVNFNRKEAVYIRDNGVCLSGVITSYVGVKKKWNNQEEINVRFVESGGGRSEQNLEDLIQDTDDMRKDAEGIRAITGEINNLLDLRKKELQKMRIKYKITLKDLGVEEK